MLIVSITLDLSFYQHFPFYFVTLFFIFRFFNLLNINSIKIKLNRNKHYEQSVINISTLLKY